MLDAHRERLLHHHVDVAPRAGLDDLRVVVGARERGDRIGLHALQHRLEVGEEEGVRQSVALGVFAVEGGVGIRDADDRDAGTILGRAQEALDVSVDPAMARRSGLSSAGPGGSAALESAARKPNDARTAISVRTWMAAASCRLQSPACLPHAPGSFSPPFRGRALPAPPRPQRPPALTASLRSRPSAREPRSP
jgi:hypothetical protein